MKRYEILQKESISKTAKAWIRLTRCCNNHCLFCLDKEAQNDSFISKKKIFDRLKNAKALGAKRAVLSGGEPTIHPDFLEIIKFSKEIGYQHTQVITNGRMFSYDHFLRRAVDSGLKEITFSFHGHNARIHDYLTQTKGSFQQALTGLRNAFRRQSCGLIVGIDIVLNRLNIKHIDLILAYFIRLGVREFDLLQIIPFGRAWDYKKLLFYDIHKNKTKLRKVFKLAKNKNLHIWTNRFPAIHLEGFEFLMQDSDKLFDEISGRSKIFNDFLHKGIAIPCESDRCHYCFLSGFCLDLKEFYDKKILISHKLPWCFLGAADMQFEEKKIQLNKRFSIIDFLNFYISHRYFLKSQQCYKCVYHGYCQGMQYDVLKKEGFAILQPLKN